MHALATYPEPHAHIRVQVRIPTGLVNTRSSLAHAAVRDVSQRASERVRQRGGDGVLGSVGGDVGLVDRALAPLELTAGYGGAEGGTCEREEGRRGREESATHRREEALEESEEQSIKDWREEGDSLGCSVYI